MSDWTPGPWRFSRELNVFEVSPADDDAPSVAFVVAAPDLEHSAFNAEYFADNLTKTKLPEWGAAMANAYLIAAAPDLYEALLECRTRKKEENWPADCWCLSDGDGTIRGDHSPACEKAVAALAKAKP